MADLFVGINVFNGVSLNGEIPWFVSAHFNLYKKYTFKKKVLVSSKTYNYLPMFTKREYLIVGKNYLSLESALAQKPDIIIGGGSIFEQCLDLGVVDEIIMCHVEDWTHCDLHFKFTPELLDKWELYKTSRGKKGIKQPKIKHHFVDKTMEEIDPKDRYLNF